jgi:holo-[acyl-carrier protein] synthase
MTAAVGIDIEDVARFKALVRERRFLQRVYTPVEAKYCASKKNKLQHFAARFAAKEAVWKALSAALAKKKIHLSHRDIGVANDASGKPHVSLPASLRGWAARVSLSLSHTKTTVVAVAIFQQ